MRIYRFLLVVLVFGVWFIDSFLNLGYAVDVSYRKPIINDISEFKTCIQRNPFTFVHDASDMMKTEKSEDHLMPMSVPESEKVESKEAPIVSMNTAKLKEDVTIELSVTGIGLIGRIQKVFFEDSHSKKSYYLAIGEEEDEIKVISINANLVTFEIQGQAYSVEGDF